MPILSQKRYVCKICSNSFLLTTGDIMDKCSLPICRECGSMMRIENPEMKDRVNIAEYLRGARHTFKCPFGKQ